MMSRLVASGSTLRRFVVYATALRPRSLPKFANCPKVFLTSYALFGCSYREDPMENFDLKLQEACKSGETAVVEFIDSVKNQLEDIVVAYKESLSRQIEIIAAASKGGATSDKWDDLTEYRTLAKDLSDQFHSFVVTINTLGQIAENETLKYITQQEKLFQLLTKKHKELDKLLKKHMKDIKKLEDKVLAKTRESIQK